jgi:hypothetical protein
MRRWTTAVVSAAWMAAGCAAAATEAPEATVTVAELCADPDAYVGREVTLEVAIDPSSLALWMSAAQACSEEAPCCNTADFVFALPCATGPQIALGPAEGADTLGLTCRGLAVGAFPAECRPTHCGTEAALGIRTVRGTLSGMITTVFAPDPPYRAFRVTHVERGAIPDAGALPDAGPLPDGGPGDE